jgi:ATP-dependent Zn protease
MTGFTSKRAMARDKLVEYGMNERIQELAKQAAHAEGWGPEVWQTTFTEKFAELIVRECCDIFVELRTRPADLAVKDVKKHFGVEE